MPSHTGDKWSDTSEFRDEKGLIELIFSFFHTVFSSKSKSQVLLQCEVVSVLLEKLNRAPVLDQLKCNNGCTFTKEMKLKTKEHLKSFIPSERK